MHRNGKTLLSILLSSTLTVLLGVTTSGASGLPARTNAGAVVTLQLFQCETCTPFPYQITDFEKAHPNIHIAVSQVPFGEFYAKTSVLAGSSSPPDIYTVDQPTIANLAAAGVILPLTKLLSPSYVSSLNASAKAELSYNGQLYSPGPIDTALALYYNKTLLDKVGIHPPTSLSDAWTWPQALKAMQACQQGPLSNPTIWGLAATTFGPGTPGFDYVSLLFLRSEGNPHSPVGSPAYNTYLGISPNGKTMNGYINTPQAAAGAKFYAGLFQGKTKVSPSTGDPNQFIDGDACFDENTSNYIDTMNQSHVKFQWGVTPLPYFTTPIVHVGSTELAIGAKTKYVQQALTFLNFIASDSQQLGEVAQTGYLPVVGALYKKIPQLNNPPWSIFAGELAKWGVPRLVTPHYVQFSDLFTKAMEDIAYGANAQSRLNAFVQQMDPLLNTPPGAL
jgi:fructooligosaccharide transport system substrate-binding protein